MAFFRIKKADDTVVYIPLMLGCKRYKCIIGDDGFLEKVICRARKNKPECKGCWLSK